jgi:hypothetical protein
MSDRDRLRDLPSVDRLTTAVARAELQARRDPRTLTDGEARAARAARAVSP